MFRVKYKFLLLLLIFALTFLYAQYKIFDDVSKPGSEFVNIRDFVNICTSHGVDVILLESTILRSILSPQRTKFVVNGTQPGEKQIRGCMFLCVQERVTTFAVMETSWKTSGLLDELQIFGYTWLSFTHPDPRLLNLDVQLDHNISTHYLFWRQSHIVHLVLLYERQGPFLWHSAIRFTPQQKKWLDEIDFDARKLQLGRYQAAIPRFQVSHVTIDRVAVIAPKYPNQLLTSLQHSRYTECDYQRARRFYSNHVRDVSDQAMTFRKRAKSLLKVAKLVLDEMNIPFWLSSGTCLGWYRQCDIIPYSLDVDIGIQIEHYHPDIITRFNRAYLPLHYKFGRVNDSLQLAFMQDQVKLDVYFFYTDDVNDVMWNGGTHARSGKKFKYLFPKFTLCWTSFLDMLLRVPCQTQSYIEANYGTDWYEPVTKWSWRESPPNIRDNGAWPRDQWDDVIQLY